MNVGIKGTFTIMVRDESGKVKQELKFDNLITDSGMDRIAGNPALGPYSVVDLWDKLALSTNSVAPTNGDVVMGGTVVTSTTVSTIYPNTVTSSGSPLWKQVWQVGFRFNAGAATGTWSSVGLMWTTGLFCRTLILSGGTPTAITVLATESLDIRYELTLVPNLVDNSGTVVINGTTHNWTGRVWAVNDVVRGTLIKRTIGGPADDLKGALVYGSSISLGAVNAGNAGAETIPPQVGVTQVFQGGPGIAGSPTSTSMAAYVPGSFTRAITLTWSAAVVAASGLVSGCTFRAGGPIFHYQYVFSPFIPKASTDQLSLTFTVSWSRV